MKKEKRFEGFTRRPTGAALTTLERKAMVLLFSIYGTYKAVAERLGYSTKHIMKIIKDNGLEKDIQENGGKLKELIMESACRYALFGHDVEAVKIFCVRDQDGNNEIIEHPYIKHYPPSEKILSTLLGHFHGIKPESEGVEREIPPILLTMSLEEARKAQKAGKLKGIDASVLDADETP